MNSPALAVARSRTTPHSLLALTSAALVYGSLAGIRWPQVYALTHWLIDYHYGFGKRGLIGTILRLVDRPPYHYITLTIMAAAVFFAGLAMLVVLGWRAARRDTGVAAAYALFFVSAGYASWVRDVGRGEHFGLLLMLPCLAMPATPVFLVARVVLMALALLVHEANFLVFAPIVIVDTYWALRATGAVQAAAKSLAVAGPVAVLAYWLGNSKTACDLMPAWTYFAGHAADFRVWNIAISTLCLDGAANWRHAHDVFTWREVQPIQFALAALVGLPGTLVTFMLITRVVRRRPADETLALLAILSPYALLFVATDVVRFALLVSLTSLVTLIACVRRLGVPAEGTLQSRREMLLLAAVAVLELGGSVPLGDGQEMLKFPFAPLVEHLDDALHHRVPFLVIPSD